MTALAKPGNLTAWIQRGLLLLIALMPFHAFFSIGLGHIVGAQAVWQSWKELLLLVLTAVTLALLYREPSRWQRLRTPFNYCFLAFILVALMVTAFHFSSPTTALFGLKTDIEFVMAFFIAQLVADTRLVRRAINTVIISSGAVIAFGLMQIFILPKDWLAQFGYNASTVQPFLPLDPALDTVRIIATLGGPNQLGSFLILPLCLILWRLLQQPRWWHALYLACGLVVMWHTYARGAQIALAAAFGVILLLRLKRRFRLPALLGIVALAALLLQLLINNIGAYPKLQYYIFHQTAQDTGVAASTEQHGTAIKEGLKVVAQTPEGLGLGSAGPASFRGNAPVIPESYYLQLAIETGVLGFLLFCGGQALLGWRLWQLSDPKSSKDKKDTWVRPAAGAAVAALTGIAILNLVLHGWTDSSTALIFWSFTGAVVGSKA
ncbi:MAG TPA: O-antigen ligase family protein [Candidatus Polarisedimenticolaceae bacterium]|nr:O-antigen ligase family protein [Candidatus Polarisedimenticolaceae bacterium]